MHSLYQHVSLYLLFCRITNAGLPSGLARLPYLKSIGLKRNCLTSVPRMLGQMHSLQEIYLEDNNDLEVMSQAWQFIDMSLCLATKVDLYATACGCCGNVSRVVNPCMMLHVCVYKACFAVSCSSISNIDIGVLCTDV